MIEMCESCRDEPGHDEEKPPPPLTNLTRAAVGLARRSTFARCREMAGSVAGHDAETACSPLNLAPMGPGPAAHFIGNGNQAVDNVVLQIFSGPDHRQPHVRHGAVVEAQSFLRLMEVFSDHI